MNKSRCFCLDHKREAKFMYDGQDALKHYDNVVPVVPEGEFQ